MSPTIAWVTVIGTLAMAGTAVGVDDVAMRLATDEELRQWIDDLEDRVGIDVTEVRPNVERYIAARAALLAQPAARAASLAPLH